MSHTGANYADDLFRLFVVSDSGCWEWTRARTRLGYGLVTVDGRQQYTHRLAWERMQGPIPDGLRVLHHCDNPPCMNPAHLFLGTAQDNSRDMAAKGRMAQQKDPSKVKRGADHWRRKVAA